MSGRRVGALTGRLRAGAAAAVAAAALLGIAAAVVGGSAPEQTRDGGAPLPEGAPTVAWPGGLDDGPVVVAVDDPRGTLQRALGEDDARLREVARALRWADDGAQAARALGVVTAPHLLLVGRGPDGDPVVVDACEPVGAARPEAQAVLRALRRFAETEGEGRIAELRGRVADSDEDAEAALDLAVALEAAGDLEAAEDVLADALARERSTVGPVHRFAEWRELLRAGEGFEEDARGALRAALKVEASKRVLYRGWGLIATVQADRLARATDDGTRAEARTWLLEATREAYQRCPDRDLAPMLEVIVERFAADPEAVDAMDRYFLRGRVNQLERMAPDSPWVGVGRELTAPR